VDVLADPIGADLLGAAALEVVLEAAEDGPRGRSASTSLSRTSYRNRVVTRRWCGWSGSRFGRTEAGGLARVRLSVRTVRRLIASKDPLRDTRIEPALTTSVSRLPTASRP
jgi:hypothetical protein